MPDEPRVFPVGRLDYDTEGLLLLTNDGDLTQLLTHPSFGVVKTYLAEVEGDPAPATVRALREGVELDDGRTAPARVNVVQRRGGTAAIEIGIHEGRNRQVRRMCEAVGHPVRAPGAHADRPAARRLAEAGRRGGRCSRGRGARLYEAASADAPTDNRRRRPTPMRRHPG